MVDERGEYIHLVPKKRTIEKLPKKNSKELNLPSVLGRMSYKLGNPIKKVLAHKGINAKVHGSKEKTNLMRASW